MTCAACQAELARCHDLAAAVRAAADGWEPSAEHFARVLARLDATTASATPQRRWWDTVRAQYERYGAMLHRTPPLIRWTLVTQSAFTLVFVGMLVWQAPWAPERFYRTLSSSSDQTAQKRLADTRRLRGRYHRKGTPCPAHRGPGHDRRRPLAFWCLYSDGSPLWRRARTG